MSVTKLYKNLRQDRLASYKQLQTGREKRPVPKKDFSRSMGRIPQVHRPHPLRYFLFSNKSWRQ